MISTVGTNTDIDFLRVSGFLEFLRDTEDRIQGSLFDFPNPTGKRPGGPVKREELISKLVGFGVFASKTKQTQKLGHLTTHPTQFEKLTWRG